MAAAGCTALQKGPLWWAVHHRHHHAHSDTEGDVHSPRGEGPTRLIRIEGTNMDKVKRLSFEKV